MNIRQAILKAADSVEHSGNYEFMCVTIHDCGTPMCMLGWIGHHLGLRGGISNAVNAIGLKDEMEFYLFLRAQGINDSAFHSKPSEAARGMRLFADAHFPEPSASRALIPKGVARIFRMSHAELVSELEPAA